MKNTAVEILTGQDGDDNQFKVIRKNMPRYKAEFQGAQVWVGSARSALKWIAWGIYRERYVTSESELGKSYDNEKVGCFEKMTGAEKGKTLREINQIATEFLKMEKPLYPLDLECPYCGWKGYYCECERDSCGEYGEDACFDCPSCHDDSPQEIK